MVVGCFILWSIFVVNVRVNCQSDPPDFININCGIPVGQSYDDPITKLHYISDANFTDRGVINNILSDYIYSGSQILTSLRSFPDGGRNCYTLQNLVPNAKYLIRAHFKYGNYDGLNSPYILFELHLGVNVWAQVNISSPSGWYTREILTVAEFDFVSVCLVDINSGTPFISALELRPLLMSIYPAVDASTSLVLNFRINIEPSGNEVVRFPDDPYDRIWNPFITGWRPMSTIDEVKKKQGDLYLVPSKVLQTAGLPPGNSTRLDLRWPTAGLGDHTIYKQHIFMYFAEIQPASRRTFNVYLNEKPFNDNPFTPTYFVSDYLYTTTPWISQSFRLWLQQDNSSTLPPIFNALETYWIMTHTEVPTDNADVVAIKKIKALYDIKRNWMGDPCVPQVYAWNGLNCTYNTASAPARIIALNISSSGLTGEIPNSIADLDKIATLDLSGNGFSGSIPDFLGDLTALKLLNLSGNNLSGSVPPALIQKQKDGYLTLSIENNPSLCITCVRKKKRIWITILIISLLSVVLLLVVLCSVRKMRTKKQVLFLGDFVKHKNENSGLHEIVPFQAESRQFTYLELQKITKNFQLEIGKGGFGPVYHGTLDFGIEVAVKMRHQLSSQGVSQLMTEVKLLSRIHHRNLVCLVGYCNEKIWQNKQKHHIEENCLALVYEYMPERNLEDNLRDKEDNARGLCWRQRVRIALEAAEGIDYLHKGCNPPIVHRDIKTSNILLDQNLVAKIADFGFSRVFQNEASTHVSTVVVGTLGYLDPEYHNTFQLTRKSDVYSFGVVLLELITGQPAVLQQQGQDEFKIHITQWVRQNLDKGDVVNLVDSRLEADSYNVNTVWMVVDIAVKCTAATSGQRPDMTTVAAQLKEALDMEVGNGGILELGMDNIYKSESENNTFELDLLAGPSGR